MKQEVFYRPVGDYELKSVPYYVKSEALKLKVCSIPAFNTRKDMNFNPKNTSLVFPLYSKEQLFEEGFEKEKIIKYNQFISMLDELPENIEDCFIEVTIKNIQSYYSDKKLPYFGAAFFNKKARIDKERKIALFEEEQRNREIEKLVKKNRI